MASKLCTRTGPVPPAPGRWLAGLDRALLGGVAMGYDARPSDGCDIGAYFGAVAVGDPSGRARMVLALAGS